MGISIAGGVCHNIGQLIVAMIVVETFAISYYMPVLLVAGLVTGFLIGVVADQTLKRAEDRCVAHLHDIYFTVRMQECSWICFI